MSSEVIFIVSQSQGTYFRYVKEFYTIDASRYPIILIHVYPVNPTFEQIDRLYEELEAILDDTTGGYVAITEAPNHFVGSEARVRLGQLAKNFYQKYKDREVGSILVAKSTITKIMLQTIQLLFRPYSQRQVIVDSLDEAMQIAKERLTKASSAKNS